VLAGLAAGYLMALAGLWAGRVPGLVAINIADYGRRYMISDRPSAWLLGLASHLANSVLLVLFWAMLIEPNVHWPRPLVGLIWGEALAFTLTGALVAPLSSLGFMGWKTGSPRFALTNLLLHALWGLRGRRAVRPAMNSLRVPQPIQVLHSGQVTLACGMDGQLLAEELHGLFAADTRMLSTYRIGISGHSWRLLGRSRSGRAAAAWQFENSPLRDPDGELAAGTLLLSLRRQLSGVLHDDLRVRAFVQRPARVQLALQLDADFADIFQVKEGSLPPRLNIRRVAQARSIALTYERARFRRAIRITFDAPDPSPTFVGALVLFDLELGPGAEWACCLEAVPEIDGETLTFAGDRHVPESSPAPEAEGLTIQSEPLLENPFRRGRADLRALAVPQPGHPSYVAAGVPWFLTLFGRDSLVTAIMAGLDGAWSAEGAAGNTRGRQRLRGRPPARTLLRPGPLARAAGALRGGQQPAGMGRGHAAADRVPAPLFLGLVPDAPRERCFLAPWLPDWLSRVEIRGITIGRRTLDVSIIKRGRETVIEHVQAHAVEVVRGTAEAALWGDPPEAREAG
jgi:hypothetical protein